MGITRQAHPQCLEEGEYGLTAPAHRRMVEGALARVWLATCGVKLFFDECSDCVDKFRGRGCPHSSPPINPRILRVTCAEMYGPTGQICLAPAQPFVQKDCWIGLAVRHSASKLEATMPTVQRVQTCPAADPNTRRGAPTQLLAGDSLPCEAKMYRVRTCGVLTQPG